MIQSAVNDSRPVAPQIQFAEGVLVNRQDLSKVVSSTIAKMEELVEKGDEVRSMFALETVDKAFVRVWSEMGHSPGASEQLPEGDELPEWDELPSDDASPQGPGTQNAPVSHGIDVEEIPRSRLIKALWPWFKQIEEQFSIPGVKLTTELMVAPSLYGGDLVRVAFVEPHSLEETAPQNTEADSAPVQIYAGKEGVTVNQEQLPQLLNRCLKLVQEDIEKGGRVKAVFEAEQLPEGQVRLAFTSGQPANNGEQDFQKVDETKSPASSKPVPEESEIAQFVKLVKWHLMYRYKLDRQVVEDLPMGWNLSEWSSRMTNGVTPDKWAKKVFDTYGFGQTPMIDPEFCTFEEARSPNAIVSSAAVFTPIQRIRLNRLDGTRRGSIVSKSHAVSRATAASLSVERCIKAGSMDEGDLHTVSILVGKLKGNKYWVSTEHCCELASKRCADKPVDPADPTITSEYQDQPQIQAEPAADELDPASIAPLHSVGVRPDSKDEALSDAESAELNRMIQEVASEGVFLSGPERVTPMGLKKRMMLDGEVCIDLATKCFVDPKSVDTSKSSTADGEDSDAAEYEYLKQYLQNSQQLHHGMAPEVIDLVLATESPSFWLKTGAVISELEAAFKQVCDNLTRDMSDEEKYELNQARSAARNALLYFFKSPFDTSKFIAEAKEILRKEYGWPESLIDSKDWSHKRWAELQAEGHTAASVIQRYFPL